jgi:hypothetical protein
MEGVVNFSQKEVRPALQKMLAATHRKKEAEAKKIAEVVNDPKFDETLDRMIDRHLTISPNSGTDDASNSPESSASNQDETPSQA